MDLISQFVPAEFPLWIQMNGVNTVAFIEAYYEWMEQFGNVEWQASNILNIRDIDSTFDQFLIYFQYEFMNKLPANIVANKRILLKHIVNLYQSKGTPRGFALLFRILFNTDINVYLPGKDLFKTSDNQWIQPAYIEVSDSPYLAALVGCSIYDFTTGATALVESYDVITQNNKVINVLSLSNINGLFLYGDYVFSSEVSYTINSAPIIVGSLSATTITNGGINWNVGDIVSISGTGLSEATGAIGRVATIRTEAGKVIFDLVNGGYGFSLNAIVSVLGGGGSGATFSVGSLINSEVYNINTDTIGPYYNTLLDIPNEGFTLNLSNVHGTFEVSEQIIATSANSVQLDFTFLVSNNMTTLESLSNSSQSITVEVANLVPPNFMTVIGNQANLAALTFNTTLISNITSSVIKVNSPMTGIQVNSTNGQITAANATSITIENANNYILATANVTGQISHANGTVTSVVRDTNWLFQESIITNLDTPIDLMLNIESLVIGTIASLSQIDPGTNYGSNPVVTIEEPAIAALAISDGVGGIWGFDANVTATTSYANGIATSVQIISSGFAFEGDDQLVMTNPNNYSSITGTAIVDSNGIGEGYWTSNSGFLSDTQRLQDSLYYQNWSYEIQSSIPMNLWANSVQTLMHPVGYAVFGKFSVHDSQTITPSVVYTNLVVT